MQLTEARENAGFTLEQVAAVSGYSFASIYNYERGLTEPPERSKQPLLDAIKTAADSGIFSKTTNTGAVKP